VGRQRYPRIGARLPRRYRSVAALLVALGGLLVLLCEERTPLRHLEPATVVKVRDGDTIELADGRIVRYIGIDTPETGRPGADSATAFNLDYVLGKTVRLEIGNEAQDRYGRTLAFVFVDDRMVNLELVKAGWAWCYFFEKNMDYSGQFVRAIHDAMNSHRGLWRTSSRETAEHYVGSFTAFRFHKPDCESVASIKRQNEMSFPSRDSAFYSGFAPCGRCQP